MAKKTDPSSPSPLTDLHEGRGAFTPIPGESRSAHFRAGTGMGKTGAPAKGKVPSTKLGSQPFETHVQNTMESVTDATPDQKVRGGNWYPSANKDVQDLAVSNLAHGVNYNDAHGISRARRVPGDTFHVSPYGMEKAAAEISALSPARPAGMSWATKEVPGKPTRKLNVPAAHQVRTMTPGQVKNMDSAVAAGKVQRKAGGVRTAARNSAKRGVQTEAEDATYGHGGAKAEVDYELAQDQFKAKSAKARAPFKGTPLGLAGIDSMKRAHDISADKYGKPLEALGDVKEGSFAHDMLRPNDADKVFNGESGTIDEHQRNVMEGKGVHHSWVKSVNKKLPARTAPDPGKKAGYEYGRTVLHEAARRMTPEGTAATSPSAPSMRPNAAQPTSWISEKESKPTRVTG